MSEIPRGPEDIPLKSIIKELWLIVTIVDIKSDRKIREEKINYSERDQRIWLGKVTAWAVTNHYEVRTCAEKDYKL